MSTLLNCKGCGCSAQVSSNNVGDMAQQSAFAPIFTSDGGLLWVCAKCWAKIEQGYALFSEVLKDETKNASLYQIGIGIKHQKEKP
jgi:hypothetical protein